MLGGFLKKVFGKDGGGFNYFTPAGKVKDGNLGLVVADANKGGHNGLNLSGAEITKRGILKLKEMKTLRALTLKGSTIEEPDLAALRELPELEYLDLSGVELKGSCFVEKAIGTLPKLYELKVADTHFVDVAVLALRAYPSLAVLDLSRTKITDGSVPHLLQLPALKEVHLHGVSLDMAVLAQFTSSNIKVEWDL